jgi:hypothetical protein
MLMAGDRSTLLDRMQVEADTWDVEEPERVLWMEAKSEIEKLRAFVEGVHLYTNDPDITAQAAELLQVDETP